MDHKAIMVERLARDFVQRIRVGLSNLGSSNEMIEKLQAPIAEHVAGDVCATLGIDYAADPNPKRHPWTAQMQKKQGQKGPRNGG